MWKVWENQAICRSNIMFSLKLPSMILKISLGVTSVKLEAMVMRFLVEILNNKME